jgi:hypothetical protein
VQERREETADRCQSASRDTDLPLERHRVTPALDREAGRDPRGHAAVEHVQMFQSGGLQCHLRFPRPLPGPAHENKWAFA